MCVHGVLKGGGGVWGAHPGEPLSKVLCGDCGPGGHAGLVLRHCHGVQGHPALERPHPFRQRAHRGAQPSTLRNLPRHCRRE